MNVKCKNVCQIILTSPLRLYLLFVFVYVLNIFCNTAQEQRTTTKGLERLGFYSLMDV